MLWDDDSKKELEQKCNKTNNHKNQNFWKILVSTVQVCIADVSCPQNIWGRPIWRSWQNTSFQPPALFIPNIGLRPHCQIGYFSNRFTIHTDRNNTYKIDTSQLIS
jgi:hypothetical protein